MRTLAEQFDDAGRGPEADQWLADMGKEGNLYALHVLVGRLYMAHRDADGERVWRWILEAGNSAALENLAQRLDQTDPQPPRVSDATASSREALPRRRGRDWRLEENAAIIPLRYSQPGPAGRFAGGWILA